MKLLLDTHTFLWFISGDSRLESNARALVEDITNKAFLSVASLWEMAIKISLGKLSFAQPFEVLIAQQLGLNRIDLLGITIKHAAALTTLPFHHRDPFDRLLIVQAQVEQLSIVTCDTLFDAYTVTRVW
jgi:PIN domain nuclease of toxin-antitoxin system